MRSITLYFCGTSFDRNSMLGAHGLQDTFNITTSPCWIFDGPGSMYGIPTMKLDRDAHGNSMIVATGKGWRSDKRLFSGNVSGAGVNDNVLMAVEMISSALGRDRHREHTCINLVGHSRGAITAMLVSHKLINESARLGIDNSGIHLYLNDPVYGYSIPQLHEVNYLPAGADSAWVIQMEDLEFSCNMMMGGTPQLQPDEQHHQIIYPMPGGHGDAFQHQKNGAPIGVIGTALLHEFLTARQVSLRKQLRLTELEYCELYAQVKLGLLHRSFWSGKLSVKSRASTRAAWVRNEYRKHTVFVNWHHVMNFESICPSTFNRIRAQDRNWAGKLPKGSQAETTKIIRSMPFTAKLFAMNGLLNDSEATMANDTATTSHASMKSRVRTVFGY